MSMGVSCDRKRVFKREDWARRELRRMRRCVIDWFRLGYYYCDRHRGYHIGNRRVLD